jgi:hypothetical protein
LFVCLFIATQALFQLSDGCHHYRWQGCKFRPMLSTYGFQQWKVFYVWRLLRHRTSAYMVSSKRPTFMSHIGIQTHDVKIIRSLHRCSNHSAMLFLNLWFTIGFTQKQWKSWWPLELQTHKAHHKLMTVEAWWLLLLTW